MATLSTFDLNRSTPEVINRTVQPATFPAYVIEERFLLPLHDLFHVPPGLSVDMPSRPSFGIENHGLFSTAFRHAALCSRARDSGRTIAPHQMHLRYPHDISQTAGAHWVEASPGLSPEGSEPSSPETNAEDNVAGLTSKIQIDFPPHEDECEPAAGPSRRTYDALVAAESPEMRSDSSSSKTEERAAKRPRRTRVELLENSSITKAQVCGLSGCQWPLTTSDGDNREHVRTVHYKVDSAYTAQSSETRPRCLHGGCKEQYWRIQDLTRHIQAKHWKREFLCEKCNHAFTQLYSLDRHKHNKVCSAKNKRKRRGRK